MLSGSSLQTGSCCFIILAARHPKPQTIMLWAEGPKFQTRALWGKQARDLIQKFCPSIKLCGHACLLVPCVGSTQPEAWKQQVGENFAICVQLATICKLSSSNIISLLAISGPTSTML